MSFSELSQYILSQNILSQSTLLTISNVWPIPAGIVILYFYGRYHFNTPNYPLVLSVGNDDGVKYSVRLITQASPILTTQRARYNNYALRYILVLEIAFLVIVFAYTTILYIFKHSVRQHRWI